MATSNLKQPTLSEMIEERRLQLGLTKSEAARIAGVSRGTWHEVESGKRTNMLADTLNLFDKALGYERGHLRKMTRGGVDLAAPQTDSTVVMAVEYKDRAGRRLDENELRMQLVRYAAMASPDALAQVALFISYTAGGEWSWLRAELQPPAHDEDVPDPDVPHEPHDDDDRGAVDDREQGPRPSRDGTAPRRERRAARTA